MDVDFVEKYIENCSIELNEKMPATIQEKIGNLRTLVSDYHWIKKYYLSLIKENRKYILDIHEISAAYSELYKHNQVIEDLLYKLIDKTYMNGCEKCPFVKECEILNNDNCENYIKFKLGGQINEI